MDGEEVCPEPGKAVLGAAALLRERGEATDLPAMQIGYLDGPRLRRSLLAACAHTEAQRRELNRINVFPVPDGDTGTNLALTVRAIAEHLSVNRDRGVSQVAREAAEAAILGARGNSGMMLSHFLIGFADEVEGEERIGTERFSRAMEAGVRALYAAIERPVEGTILTVMRETSEAAGESEEPDFKPYIDALVARARESLRRTPELLPVLQKSGVVDAGAKGFVALLEGVASYIAQGDLVEGLDFVAAPPDEPSGDEVFAAAAHAEYAAGEEYRFCTEGLVRGEGLPDREVVQDVLREMGDSLVVIRSGDLLKVHIHTDEPGKVFAYLRSLGTLATHKAEDMEIQHGALAGSGTDGVLARRPVAFVTETTHDLPEEVIRAHGVHVVPLLLLMGDQVLRDSIDITAQEFHGMMERQEELPTTSQPAPADFLTYFRRAAEEGEEILYVGLGSRLSGTFGSAEAAAARFDEVPIHAVDSRGASLLEGLLLLKGCELAEAGMPPAEVAATLRKLRDRSNIFVTVDTFERLLASGRVGKGKAWFGRMLGLKPILDLDEEGVIRPIGKALGRDRVVDEVMRILLERVPPGSVPVRFGVVHVGRPDVVERLSALLREHYGAEVEILTGLVTPVIATHVGPGAWGLAYLVEEA